MKIYPGEIQGFSYKWDRNVGTLREDLSVFTVLVDI